MRSSKFVAAALAGLFLVAGCDPQSSSRETAPQSSKTVQAATGNDALAPNACDLLSAAEIKQALGVTTKADQAAKSDLDAVPHNGSEFGDFYTRQCTLTPDGRKVGEADIVVTASQFAGPDNAIASYTKSVSGMNNPQQTVLRDGVQATTDYMPGVNQAQVLLQKNNHIVSVIVNGPFADAQAAATTMAILGDAALTHGNGSPL